MLTFDDIADKLREATSLVAESLQHAGYPERVNDTYELIDANEYGIAFENLCMNLYDVECAIPKRAYELFDEVGSAMRVDDKTWTILRSRVAG